MIYHKRRAPVIYSVMIFHQNRTKRQNRLDTPKMTNGLVHYIECKNPPSFNRLKQDVDNEYVDFLPLPYCMRCFSV